jgi:hypothetical protein
LVLLAIGTIAAILLTIWGTIIVIDKYVLMHDTSDPLVRAGGLRPDQAPVQPK